MTAKKSNENVKMPSIGRKFVDQIISPTFDQKWRYSLLVESKRISPFCRMPSPIIFSLLVVILIIFYVFHGIQNSSKFDEFSFNNSMSNVLPKLPMANPPPFNRWALERNKSISLDCARIISNDTAYIREKANQRIQFSDPDDLNMDCETGIHWRNYFTKNGDAQFPLAQARIVYRDYVFLEMELASSYSPNNWYCYILDEKSNPLFHYRMRKLAECLPNVLIAPKEFNIDANGHNITRAHLECLAMLATPQKQWKYVALLQYLNPEDLLIEFILLPNGMIYSTLDVSLARAQLGNNKNHDSSIKTNRQMVQIYKWLDGANDVEVTHLPEGRVNDKLDWSFEAIDIFKGNSKRNQQNSSNGFPPKLIFSKGYVQSSLSREMAEFMLNELDLTEIVRRLESGGFGIDEILVPTLHAADALQAPGGFTHICLDKGKNIQHITRETIWHDEKACGSHHMRHSICVFGLEDLPLHLNKWPHLFANKFQPDFDFGAALCWYEIMHNRTNNPVKSDLAMASLNSEYYVNLAHVRFQQFKRDLAKLNNNAQSMFFPYKQAIEFFNCTETF